MPLAYSALVVIFVYPNQAIFEKLGLNYLDPIHTGVVVVGAILYFLIMYASPGKVTPSNQTSLAFPDYIKKHYSKLELLSKFPDPKMKDGKSSSPWPDFSDPIYNGLREQDREKTSYGDEEDSKQAEATGDQSDIEHRPGSTSRAVELQVEGVQPQEVTMEIPARPLASIPRPEKHYCSVCMVDQPIRAKHCSLCQRCVPTFDHHCLWVGNCIGEKNRPLFLVFLVYQTLELVVLPLRTFTLLWQLPGKLVDNIQSEWMVTGLGVAYLVLGLSVASLLRFHIMFCHSNMTTWEYLKWTDISYLNGFDYEDGSPFSLRCSDNVRSYFRPPCTTFYEWVPVKTPKLTN